MDTISSAEFRKRYATLTQPTQVTALGRVIGEWLPAGTYVTPAELAAMWGVAHDKVLEFIKAGELEAFNVASKRSRRPQFKVTLAAVKAFQERRSGRDPARSAPPVTPRRTSSKKPQPSNREYF